MRLALAFVTICLSTLPFAAVAEVRLPKIISDHMVLQSAGNVPVWGWADPGEKVRVKLAGQSKSVTAGPDGRWRVTFTAPKTSGAPLEMHVRGKSNELHVTDILIGEVWLASGQSNMEKAFHQPGQKDVFNAETELAAANYPQIRLFKVKKAKATQPAEDVDGQWIVCDPKSLDDTRFSAAAYYFGRRLHQTLNVPVGLIDSTWGGTRIEVWISPKGFESQAELSRFAHISPGSKVDGTPLSEQYNAMIAPLEPYALKGVIWYQGESNIIETDAQADYTAKMGALISGWRSAFERDLAFYYVQVAPHLYHVVRSNKVVSPEATPLLWEAQEAALSIPGTGMVVTTDLVDDLDDIHPRNKKDVGERLARWALSKTYGVSGLTYAGPRFKSMTVEGDKALLSFDFTGNGLVAADAKPLTWFTIAGADGVFYPGVAEITGDQITVSSPKVSAPVTVRFAWDEAARPNLMNKEGLPAWPFRSDGK